MIHVGAIPDRRITDRQVFWSTKGSIAEPFVLSRGKVQDSGDQKSASGHGEPKSGPERNDTFENFRTPAFAHACAGSADATDRTAGSTSMVGGKRQNASADGLHFRLDRTRPSDGERNCRSCSFEFEGSVVERSNGRPFRSHSDLRCGGSRYRALDRIIIVWQRKPRTIANTANSSPVGKTRVELWTRATRTSMRTGSSGVGRDLVRKSGRTGHALNNNSRMRQMG
jgi:hypothetical protein